MSDGGMAERTVVPARMVHKLPDSVSDGPAVDSGLSCLGTRNRMISVAIHENPFPVTLLKLVMSEALVQGSLAYTAEDYRAVIDLMAKGHYDTGWVSHIPIDQWPSPSGPDTRADRRVSGPADSDRAGRNHAGWCGVLMNIAKGAGSRTSCGW